MARIGLDLRMYATSFTGIGRYAFELVKNLLALDSDDVFVFFLNEPEYSNFTRQYASHLIENGGRHKAVMVDAKHYSFREQFSFLVALYKERLDLMHFLHFNSPLLYFKPFVTTIHDLTLSFFPGKKMDKFYHRLAYHIVLRNAVKRAKRVITVSKHTEIDLHRLFDFTRGKTKMIYEAVGDEFGKLPMDEVASRLSKFGIDEEFVLYTGVHRNHKNIVGLIGAFSLLVKKHGFKGYLVITGKEDPSYPEVRKTIVALGLEDKVKLLGLVPEIDLIVLYNGASVYAYPSFYEGFGLPALEAFACGTVVCASNSSCLPEICEEGALYFDPKNVEEMADTIHRALTDDNLRNDLLSKSLARLEKFSWKKMTEETMEIYKELTTRQ